MKIFSFFTSVAVFFVSLYYFILKVPDVVTLDDTIYISLLVVLMSICVCGVLINGGDLFARRRNKSLVLFVSNKFSGKSKK